MNALAAMRPPSVEDSFVAPYEANALAMLAARGRPSRNALAPQESRPRQPSMGAPAGDMAGRIRSGLVRRGLPEHVADAFILNFQDESGLDPGINEQAPIVPGSRGGFGLAQWTGPRRRQLEAFAAERGAPVSDIDVQLDFLMSEMQGPESRAARRILGAPDTGQAAVAIVQEFLRPLEQHQRSRAARYASF